jgi:hypothetical protein
MVKLFRRPARLVQAVQVGFGARRAGDVPAEPGCVRLDERNTACRTTSNGVPVLDKGRLTFVRN